jgi:hypothetical protein
MTLKSSEKMAGKEKSVKKGDGDVAKAEEVHNNTDEVSNQQVQPDNAEASAIAIAEAHGEEKDTKTAESEEILIKVTLKPLSGTSFEVEVM